MSMKNRFGPVGIFCLAMGLASTGLNVEKKSLSMRALLTASSSSTTPASTTTCGGPDRTADQQQGEWIGDTWVPPNGWTTFTPSAMQEFYQDQHVFFYGDSTARRTAMTLYGVLNSTSHHPTVATLDSDTVIDGGKKSRSTGTTLPYLDVVPCDEVGLHNTTQWSGTFRPRCRHMPSNNRNATGTLHVINNDASPCLKSVKWFMNQAIAGAHQAMQTSDIIVICVGIWEVRFPDVCAPKTVLESLEQHVNETIDEVENYQKQSGKTIVWRTTGFLDEENPQGAHANQSRQLNQWVMNRIDYHRQQDVDCGANNRLTYLDWGGAIEPRVFGNDRLQGDMIAHHGLTPRLVFLQMLTNHLKDEQERQQQQQQQQQ